MKFKYNKLIVIIGLLVFLIFLIGCSPSKEGAVAGEAVRTLKSTQKVSPTVTNQPVAKTKLEPTCKDSDGINFDKKGNTTGQTVTGTKVKPYVFEDICAKDAPTVKKQSYVYNFVVIEQTCREGKSVPVAKLCPKGYTCESGACKSVLAERVNELLSKSTTGKKFK